MPGDMLQYPRVIYYRPVGAVSRPHQERLGRGYEKIILFKKSSSVYFRASVRADVYPVLDRSYFKRCGPELSGYTAGNMGGVQELFKDAHR